MVAASLPDGKGVRQQLADRGYDPSAVLIPVPDPELIDSARQALLFVTGRNGAWHDGWISPQDAAQARQTSNSLTEIFLREQHSQDQELPLEF